MTLLLPRRPSQTSLIGNPCPACRRPPARECACNRLHFACAAGHEWHTCIIHLETHAGPPAHDQPVTQCSCPLPRPAVHHRYQGKNSKTRTAREEGY